jgi:RHS repeat-associated protein
MDPSILRGSWSSDIIRRGIAQLLVAFLVLPPPLSSDVPRRASGPRAPRAGARAGRPRAMRLAAGFLAEADPPSCRESLLAGGIPVVSVAKSELWPPNHELVDVGLRVDEGAACRDRASVGVAVWSDEPDDATGDGSWIHDAQIDPPDLYLRRERQGSGDGRVYLIVGTATYEGVAARGCGAVVVPHSQSRRDRESVWAQAQRAVEDCTGGGIPLGYEQLVEGRLSQPNQPPVVGAGPDLGIDLGASAHLDGTVSDDGLPAGRLDLAWSKVEGPGEVVFAAASAEDTDATFSASGSYLLRLTASDGELSAHDEAQVVVQAANTAPLVDAGPDRSIVLPERSTRLEGTVRDDGKLLAVPTVAWSVVGGPGEVVFEAPASPATTATFSAAGVYELRLTAHDGQLTSSDDVRVTLDPEPLPVLDVEDATVTEGNEGLTGASAELRLSKPWPQEVTVDYVTEDRTAARPCDYARRFGTLTFSPGETARTVLVPVVGDRVAEGDEQLGLLLGNPAGATLAREAATVRIVDDDLGSNEPPSALAGRTPPDGAAALPSPPTLAWSASDPDPGDTLVYDVHLGTAFSRTGQQWLPVCAGGEEPGPRWGAVSGYDEANGRLIVYGGQTPGGPDAGLFVLVNASGTGGAPTWLRVPVEGGPGPLAFAGGGYEPSGNRLVVFGGCAGSCDTPSAETWVLQGANGLGGPPSWTRLAVSGPSARFGHAAALDPATDRLYVFGGTSSESGPTLDDLWVLESASGAGQPRWLSLAAEGDAPSARRDAGLAHDPRSGRLVLFGGTAEDEALDDVRVLVPDAASGAPSWQRLSPAGEGPAARFGAAVAYDPASERLLVYGGSNGAVAEGLNYVFSDAWLLTGAGATGLPEWVRVHGGGTAPAGRFSPAAAFSGGANRLVVAGGGNNKLAFPPADVWLLGDAVGQLPLAAAGQSEATYVASEASTGQVFTWRVVARDGRGAWRGSPAWRFTTNSPPSVDAGPALSVEGTPATVSLAGVVADDGLPAGAPVTVSWEQVSGPAAVAFADPASASTVATFEMPGSYVLRLTAGDSQATASDEVPVEVRPLNLAPLVDAGPDVAGLAPGATITLQGSASDDGLPDGTLTVAWSQVSGPAAAVIASPAAVVTSATFPSVGTYVLRLTASDGPRTASDDRTVELSPVNLAPSVSAGPDRVLDDVQAELALQGEASDDGLPGGPLTVLWTSVSGPGTVAFGDPAAPATNACFGAAGRYELKFTASDGDLSSADETLVFVGSPEEFPDLTVPQVDVGRLAVDPRSLAVSGVVAVEVANPGSGTALGPFALTVFEDRDENGTFAPGVDAILGEQPLTGLEAGGSTVVEVPVAGAASFAGNLVYAFVDSGLAVAEADEADNYGSSSPGCGGPASSDAWNVGLEWSWTKTSADPLSTLVLSAPIVIDVNGDAVPDVVFVAFGSVSAGFSYPYQGRLRALDGRDGHEIWSVTDPAFGLTGAGRLAAGDIDGDGRPEIVGISEVATDRLLAFEHDGTFKWRSDTILAAAWGAVSIADLDADGVPEIVIGRQALTNEGHLLWTGAFAGQGGDRGPHSLVVDLDLDGKPEVLVGNTAYRGQGSGAGQVAWRNTSNVGGMDVGDGYTAVGNFDDDPYPEIVLSSRGWIWMLEHDGAVKWGPTYVEPVRTIWYWAGPPTVADVDGDGALEIAIAGAQYLTVFAADGSVKWRVPNSDTTPNVGIVAFDFDGDGAAELVHAAEADLRIFRGSDGVVLFRDKNRSSTASDSVVVADVDADGEAEIVAATDGGMGGIAPGVRVYGELNGRWPDARRTWNQFLYSVSNVDDDGQIPRREARDLARGHRWALAGSVEEGVVTPTCAFPRPDLTASALRLGETPVERRLTVRIGNGGARVVGPHVPVSFYDGDPRLGGVRLGTVETTTYLRPGRFEDVDLFLPLARTTRGPVVVSADDVGALVGRVVESDEDNNLYDTGQALLGSAGLPDLAIGSVDVSALSGDWQTLVVSGSATAVVRNLSGVAVETPFEVTFFEDRDRDGLLGDADATLGRATVEGLGGLASATVGASLSGSVLFRGSPVQAFVDSGGAVPESDEENNVGRAGGTCQVRPPGPPWSLREEWAWAAGTADVISTPAAGDLDGDGVADVVFVTTRTTSTTADGQLRAVKGRGGSERFSVTDRSLDLNPSASPALGDIDGDGRPEIVAVAESGTQLLAFEADGAPKWRSPTLSSNVGAAAPFLADLDGDGRAEVLIGKEVLNGADGSLRWRGLGTKVGRSATTGLHSVAVDLDLDGIPEVVVGSSAYRADGTLLWDTASVPDGVATAANLDGDAFPEIVLAAEALWLLEHDGSVAWGPVDLPGTSWAGPATLADVDADGRSEIGAGDWSTYSVLESYSHLRWTVGRTVTGNNADAAASAFDFDGDGAAEVVLADPTGLRVLRGRDGAVLAESPVGTCGFNHPYPVVTDVDGDGKAEILLGSNATCSGSTARGLRAFGEAGDGWVRARPLWNQYEYAVSGVRDDLTAPWPPVPAGLRADTWRANASAAGSPFAAADLTASYVRRTEEGTDLRFTVRVGNGGTSPVGPGVPVALYNGDPRLDFPFLAATATTRALGPGEYEDLSLVLPSATEAQAAVVAVADDPGTRSSSVSECDEENNLHDTGYWLNLAPVVHGGPDLTVTPPDMTVLLEGSVTDDGLPLGGHLDIQWAYVSGPIDPLIGGPTFSDPHSPTTTATFPATPGPYTLLLDASDSRLMNRDVVVVTVLPANQAPVVSAGPDQTVELPEKSVPLAGSVSDDGLPAGSVLQVAWTVVSAPGTVSFANPASAATTATLSAAGTYVLRLTATDGALSSSDEVTVTLETENQAPVVGAGPDLRVFSLVAPLAGSVSDDGKPRGGTLSSTWSLVSGPGPASFADPASPLTTATLAVPGTYVLRLTAGDGALTASDDVVVTADPANAPPSVEAGPAQSVTSRQAVLHGAVSDDGLPAGSTVTVLWSQVAGPAPAALVSPAAVETAVVLDAEGPYLFRLSASDGDLGAEDTVAVDVRFVNTAPVVDAGADATLALPANTVRLQGSVADDGLPLGSAVTQTWAVVSGPAPVVFDAPQAAETTARFTDPGTYVLRLRASDGALAAEDRVTVAVQATPPEGAPPVAALSSPSSGSRLTLPADVVGTATSDSLASWQLERRLRGETEWARFASGTTPVTDGPLGQIDPTLLLNGIHEVRLTVTDTAGRIARATIVVVVREQVKVGHFSVAFVDLEVPVAGLPIRVTRSYDSRDKGKGEFGVGWRLELANVRVQPASTLGLSWYGTVSGGAFGSYCLQATAPPLVTLTFPDGRVQEFEMRLSPQCQPFQPIEAATVSFVPVGPTLGRLSLTGASDVLVAGSWPGPMQLFGADYKLFDPSTYRYTAADGQVFVVDRVAGLKSLTDRAGNVLTMSPAGITSTHPEVPGSTLGLSFMRDAQGRITRITDPERRSLAYAYDTAGDLASVTDRDGAVTQFTYEEELPHQLRDILDPLGRRPIRNEYFEDGRLKSHTDAFGKTIEYQHDLVGRQEVVRDRTGAQRVLEYDERGNVVRETDPQGRIVVRTFDARNNRLTETEPYDPANPPNPIPTTNYTYDPSDNLLSTTDPLGNTTSYTYNATRQVLRTTDARGGITTNTYDAKGNLLTTTDALGYVSAYTYDTRGDVLTQTVKVNGVDQVTHYEYDAYGRLGKETDALGHETSYSYDQSGNRLSQTTTRTTPAGVETLLTSYEYDANGRLRKTTDPDGTFTWTVYDALGKQVESWDKVGRKTGYEYDAMGRLVKTTYPDATYEEHGYDAEGRRTSSRDRGGRTTGYEYDSLGRLRKTIYADGSFTESTYDVAGRLVTAKDAKGYTTTYEYDSAGRRTAVVDALGHRTSFTYDANGNQKTVTDARGNTVTYEYDLLNRRTKTIFPPAQAGEPITFTETGYDELGRRIRETDPAGRTTQFAYDALGRLVSVTDALGQVTSYGYDEAGNRTSQTDANGHTTAFEYDRLGRETKRTLPAIGEAPAAFETKTYDDAGNLKTRTDFMDRVTTYSYDAENDRLLSRTYPNPAENVGFTYTATGRRLTATDSRGTTAYSYDVRDRLKSLTYPDGRSLGYDYDPQGNRTKLTALITATSLVVNSSYDELGRLAMVTDPAGRVYTYGYDLNGNRETLAHPNGAQTAYVYDNLNRLTGLATTIPALSRTVQTYAFTLGPAGNRIGIVEAQGLPQQRTLEYSYDALYRLTGESVTESLGLVYNKAFGYDPVGNRLIQTTTLGPAGSPGPNLQPGTVGYGYDQRDRLLSEQLQPDPATAYGWDANGNLTTKDAEATYTWDHENRLTKVMKTDGTVVEHAYDADGNRVWTTVTPPTGPPTATDFLVDTSGSLSHVVAETDGTTGVLQAYYLRGDDLLAVMRSLVPIPASPGDWQTRYYHADGLGSIRRLTDEAGNITDGYTYSAFGELLAHTGSDPQPYAFTGEPLDPNSGWQYHRARWMDPRTGRFAGMDRLPGGVFDPCSLHRYLYANAQPSVLVDPSGLFTQAFGYAVEAAIEPLYRADHPTDGVIFGRWNRVGANPRLKPDILNYSRLQWLEIKPLSYSGVADATFKWGLYMAAFSPVGFYPDIEWEPGDGLLSVDGVPVFVFNVGGILFYTDAVDLAEDAAVLASVKVVTDAYRLLQSARLFGTFVAETARIGRLAALAATGGQSRINAAIGPAMILATLGLP